MYEVKENSRKMHNGAVIRTFSREIVSANILEVEAGTTGYMGGDGGHGGRSYFSIRDIGGTAIKVEPLGTDGDEGFEVFLAGDCELETMITALKFITKVLEDEAGEVVD